MVATTRTVSVLEDHNSFADRKPWKFLKHTVATKRERERERERERGREGGRERERERGREGGREGEREGGREGGREKEHLLVSCPASPVV